MNPRYEIRTGKFGPLFYDTQRDHGCSDGSMPLADVLTTLNDDRPRDWVHKSAWERECEQRTHYQEIAIGVHQALKAAGIELKKEHNDTLRWGVEALAARLKEAAAELLHVRAASSQLDGIQLSTIRQLTADIWRLRAEIKASEDSQILRRGGKVMKTKPINDSKYTDVCDQLDAVCLRVNQASRAFHDAGVQVEGIRFAPVIKSMARRIKRLERALQKIASCKSIVAGDVVDIARKALKGGEP